MPTFGDEVIEGPDDHHRHAGATLEGDDLDPVVKLAGDEAVEPLRARFEIFQTAVKKLLQCHVRL